MKLEEALKYMTARQSKEYKINPEHKDKFVGAFPAKLKSGAYTQMHFPVFYQENPDTAKGHLPYYMYIIQNHMTYITGAMHIPELDIHCIRAKNGEIIYSRSLHDYRQSEDASCAIDGGFDYLRTTYEPDYKPDQLIVKVKDGEFVYNQENWTVYELDVSKGLE